MRASTCATLFMALIGLGCSSSSQPRMDGGRSDGSTADGKGVGGDARHQPQDGARPVDGTPDAGMLDLGKTGDSIAVPDVSVLGQVDQVVASVDGPWAEAEPFVPDAPLDGATDLTGVALDGASTIIDAALALLDAADSRSMDTALADRAAPDVAVPDSATPDAPTGLTPDSAVPDMTAPDSTAPDVSMPDVPPPAVLSTHSFSSSSTRGSHPSTISNGGDHLTIDLRALAGATVYRAVFDPNLTAYNSRPGETAQPQQHLVLLDATGAPLPLLGPRYTSFDATQAVRAAMASGSLRIDIQRRGSLFWDGRPVFLYVTCDRPAAQPIAQATAAAARFADGDTMITFREVSSPLSAENVTCDQYNAALAALDSTPRISYRVYRVPGALTAGGQLAWAQLVDEIAPLSGWDSRFYGQGKCEGALPVPRYPVSDRVIAEPGVGIYVRRYRAGDSQEAAYFISRSVDGEEDLSLLTPGGNATGVVSESAGQGMVIERLTETPATFMGVPNPTKHHYVRWEAPPTSHMPSTPYDYLVAVPSAAAQVTPAPVDVALHCWGGSLEGGYYAWYRATEGSLLLASNQYPYDWWTAYHENLGTLRSYGEGTVQPFNQVRVLSFLYDFVANRFAIDRDRIMLSGLSMGGSGASMWGIRSGHIFSHIVSLVGVHVPRETPTFFGSFEGVYGREVWNLPYSNEALVRFGYERIRPEDRVNVWDYWDNDRWLRAHPQDEVPWMAFANGRNDNDIGWPQAWKMVQALVATRRGFNFDWNMAGHGAVARMPAVDFRRSGVQPAFLHGSCDQVLGASPEAAPETGAINAHLLWDADTVVDTADRVALWLRLAAEGPDTCTGDLVLRRLQSFPVTAGSSFTWQLRSPQDVVLQSGTVTADTQGLITVPGLSLGRGAPGRQLIVNRTAAP